MNKSLEIVNEHIELFRKYRELYAHASDIESAKDYDDDIKVFETIKKDLEAYEQLKQDHDKTLINNGELCVKVCKLEKENQELKKEIQDLKDNETIVADYGVDLWNENEKLKKVIEIITDKTHMGLIEDTNNYFIIYDVYGGAVITKKEYKLLKEVLENDK